MRESAGYTGGGVLGRQACRVEVIEVLNGADGVDVVVVSMDLKPEALHGVS